MKVKPSIVPGFFTMANMFCGFYSVLLAAQGRFVMACWLIIAASVLDVLDGKMARMVNGASEFGVQYDSLADVVSFGLAPSVLAYYVAFQTWGTIGLLISFIPLVFGSIRLARFNVQLKGFTKEAFKGIPIPASALAISTYVLFTYEIWEAFRWTNLFVVLIIVVSLLMISNFRYEMMPEFSLQSNVFNRLKIGAVFLGAILIAIYPHYTFFPLMVIYILSGLIRVLWLLVNPNSNAKKASKLKENNL